MYGYFYAQYLFSSTLTLVISSLLGPSSIGNSSDIESLDTAIEILHRMTDHGNLAAAEFYENLLRVRQALQRDTDTDTGNYNVNGAECHEETNPKRAHDSSTAEIASQNELPELPSTSPAPASGFTTEMALLEPTMQDFLGRSGSDMDLAQSGEISIGDAAGLDSWPILWTS